MGEHVLDAEPRATQSDAAAAGLAGEGAQGAHIDIQPVQQARHGHTLQSEVHVRPHRRLAAVRHNLALGAPTPGEGVRSVVT